MKSDVEEGQAVLSCQHHQVAGESGGVPVPLFLQVQARGTLPAHREPRWWTMLLELWLGYFHLSDTCYLIFFPCFFKSGKWRHIICGRTHYVPGTHKRIKWKNRYKSPAQVHMNVSFCSSMKGKQTKTAKREGHHWLIDNFFRSRNTFPNFSHEHRNKSICTKRTTWKHRRTHV